MLSIVVVIVITITICIVVIVVLLLMLFLIKFVDVIFNIVWLLLSLATVIPAC